MNSQRFLEVPKSINKKDSSYRLLYQKSRGQFKNHSSAQNTNKKSFFRSDSFERDRFSRNSDRSKTKTFADLVIPVSDLSASQRKSSNEAVFTENSFKILKRLTAPTQANSKRDTLGSPEPGCENIDFEDTSTMSSANSVSIMKTHQGGLGDSKNFIQISQKENSPEDPLDPEEEIIPQKGEF